MLHIFQKNCITLFFVCFEKKHALEKCVVSMYKHYGYRNTPFLMHEIYLSYIYIRGYHGIYLLKNQGFLKYLPKKKLLYVKEPFTVVFKTLNRFYI